jgi:hypothetical protein
VKCDFAGKNWHGTQNKTHSIKHTMTKASRFSYIFPSTYTPIRFQHRILSFVWRTQINRDCSSWQQQWLHTVWKYSAHKRSFCVVSLVTADAYTTKRPCNCSLSFVVCCFSCCVTYVFTDAVDLVTPLFESWPCCNKLQNFLLNIYWFSCFKGMFGPLVFAKLNSARNIHERVPGCYPPCKNIHTVGFVRLHGFMVGLIF